MLWDTQEPARYRYFRSGVSGNKCGGRQAIRHDSEVERSNDPIGQCAVFDDLEDLRGLAGDEPSEDRIQTPHDGPTPIGAARSAVADMTDLVGEDLVVEQRDPLGDLRFIGKQSATCLTYEVEEDASSHFGGTNERKAWTFGKEDVDLHELPHDVRRGDDSEGKAEDVQDVRQ